MCGIFGILDSKNFSVSQNTITKLVSNSEQRGRDSSGLMFIDDLNGYHVHKSDQRISTLHKQLKNRETKLILGHSRLVTNGMTDNQPVVLNDSIVFHNGIIVNTDELWPIISQKRTLEIDTEIIPALFTSFLASGVALTNIPNKILSLCKGVIACAIALTKLGKLCLFSNNGSLFMGDYGDSIAFASESYPLDKLGYNNVKQVFDPVYLDIPKSTSDIKINSSQKNKLNLIPSLSLNQKDEKLLEYKQNNLQRCTKCILPESMPFIHFDSEGECNYCRNYIPRNVPRPKKELFDLVESYRKKNANDCIVPFSGGRDSCFALHLVSQELQMKPVAYTYDWGMVTDLARRNISRMCSILEVENIIIADNIEKKRKNIRKNLTAWLNAPNLGMVSILTAGDKHFFKFVERVKKQTGINLNLWGVCPLEVTHFKSGFLGIPPLFDQKTVYTNGVFKQLRYQWQRLNAMLESPAYFNSSLWDTLSGEYHRSFKKKEDYFHIYDFWKWEEDEIDKTLESYNWEKSNDTNSTWRIGDGTAAFYNYIYYTMAGFTEHDTFRSNQIREGDLTRTEALLLINDENKPRYQNIKWYLDAVGLEFASTIKRINSFNIANS